MVFGPRSNVPDLVIHSSGGVRWSWEGLNGLGKESDNLMKVLGMCELVSGRGLQKVSYGIRKVSDGLGKG